MPQCRLSRLACLALLVTGGAAHAAEEIPRVSVEASRTNRSIGPMVKTVAQRVIALPVELVTLVLPRGKEPPTFAGQPLTTTYVAADADSWDVSPALSLAANDPQPDTIELNLSESRVALWLRDDLNLHCDLEQDPTIATGNPFAVKLALQFRFR